MDVIKNKKRMVKKVSKVNLIKVLFIVLGVLILAEALVYTILMPCLSPVKVTYSGLETFSAQQISNYLGINDDKVIFYHSLSFDVNDKNRRSNNTFLISTVYLIYLSLGVSPLRSQIDSSQPSFLACAEIVSSAPK